MVADFGRAVAQLRDPRFLGVLLKALAITVIGLALVFWAVMAGLGWILPESVALPWIGPVRFLDDLASLAAVGLMLVLSVVLMVPTAAAVVGFFLEEVAEAVEAEHYPELAPVAGPGLSAQIGDGLRFFALVVAVNLAALVVYLLLPPLAPFVFWLVNGFLLGREYFQLVAMRRLGPEGAARLRRANAGRIWLAGTAMAVPLSVPVLNLLVPILGVAVFTHQFHRLAPAP
ncbi:MAG: EI24 domain-containing protein [Rhodobacteraceae bacterium]|nr:EI24 domain-containing protein [Paracoccaceae bacterium]